MGCQDHDDHASGSGANEHEKHSIPSTLSGQTWWFLSHFKDFVPTPSAPIPLPAPSPLPPPTVSTGLSPSPEAVTSELETITTETNSFGLYQVYSQAPTVNPEEKNNLCDVCDAPGISLLQSPTEVFTLPRLFCMESMWNPWNPSGIPCGMSME